MRVIPAKNVRAGVAVFKVRKRAARSCRAARVRVGKRARRVAARRVRAAVTGQRRIMRVRLSRKQAIAARKRQPKLVIYRAPKKSSPKRTDASQPDLGTVEQAPAPAPVETAPAETAPAEATAPAGTDTNAAPETAPAEAPAAGEKSTLRPPGSPVMSDAEAAAHVRRSGAEKRPANDDENHRVPTDAELIAFRAANHGLIYDEHKALVTGNFTGTTDEIIQWAAWKWGLDEDVLRAQAVQESWWKMSEIGDNGISFGLFQIKKTVHLGTYPLSAESTAFNADYTAALFRFYYDGGADWLMDVEHGQDYTTGDQWGAIGAHYAGAWWTTGAKTYISDVKSRLTDRTWERKRF
jgi:autotransporter family porin